MSNPLVEIQRYGQSLWYDNIRRSFISSGQLQDLIDQDGLRGVTSNPAIFEKAIAGSTDYNNALKALESQKDSDAKSLYEQLAIRDIQDAADVLWSVYEKTSRRDGYVSLEVSPYLAHDTAGSIEEARRLWKAIGRENVMIKIPATLEGIPAIRQLIGDGININVTLLFSVSMYEKVMDAYTEGLETLTARKGDPSKIASVASFFISRIDSAVDSTIDARLKTASTPEERANLRNLLGQVAIANAKLTYQRYKELYRSARWQTLAARGAQPQRLLWASTSTKNPNYRDVVYIEELIGAETVDTVPSATFDAFRDHGRPRASLEENLEEAHDTMELLEKSGISMKEVTDKLLDEGVKLFADAFDKLLSAVEKKRQSILASTLDRQIFKLPKRLEAPVKATLEEWRQQGKVRRLWAGDKTLWSDDDENRWLGWLGITDDQLAHLHHLTGIAEQIKTGNFTHVLLLGMGGSSLCPEVMKMTFGKIPGFPELHVLDSTDPAQIKTFEKKVDIGKTIFIVSSKSGSTLEPNIYKQYFFERVKEAVGAAEAGRRFIAITDPGSKMQQVAEGDHFRNIFFGLTSIGGRYSALSDFGMVPSAIMGVDVLRFLDRAEEMVHSCGACVPPEDNPGVLLGTIMGIAANQGRDKLTIVASPRIWDFGAWLEQLVAESTGKIGKGIIPIDQERLGPPAVYGDDRLFVYLRLESEPDPAQDRAIAALEEAGHPVVWILIPSVEELGQEFFRWEMATAVAGAVIGINAFNQPDVEASKIATRKLTSEYEKTGSLPPEKPFLEQRGIKLFTDDSNKAVLAPSSDGDLVRCLRTHLGRIKPGDYFCISAYVEMNDAHQKALQSIRHAVRDGKKAATCLGYGPRFLHSTGQAYKGGPNSGVFVQITCDDAADLPVPGQKYTFGVVKAAQARGDLEVLSERKRRLLRVHLGADVKAGLQTLEAAVREALA